MEDYVSFEQAKKLKEFGFDEQCFAYYLYDDKLEIGRQLQKYNSEWHLINLGYIAAPTLSQAQKWLREVKGIIICIEPRFYKNKRPLFGYDYHLFNKDDGWCSYIESKTVYDTYEQALSEGIDKALEIIKNK